MIKKTLVTIVTTLLVLVTAGCATTQVPADYKPDAQSKAGVVVFSLAHDLAGGGYDQAIVYLDGGTRYSSLEEPFYGFRRPSEFSDVRGYLHVVTLPAGKHAFTGWQITNGRGLRIYPEGDLPPLTFEVEPGEVVYLGSFHGHLQRGKNIFGMEITGNGLIAVSDSSSRDLPLLSKRYPQFEGKVRLSFLRPGPWLSESSGTAPRLDPVPVVPKSR